MGADLLLVAVLLGVVRAPGVLLGFVLALILLRVTSRSAGGNMLRQSVRLSLRVGAAVILFISAITLWNAGEEALDRFNGNDATVPAADTAGAVSDDSAAVAAASHEVADTTSALMGDSVTMALVAENAELREENEEMEDVVDALRRDLEAARDEGGGVLSLIRAAANDLGIGFGWAAVYFTCFLALWRGQTPGKRMMGLRVIRLNGKPMTWWISFERFGGYTASLSTGLLGFVQILWDRNRQGIHDKVAETVVVLTRDERPSIPATEAPVQAT